MSTLPSQSKDRPTFAFPLLFFPVQTASEISTVYALCRYLDDLADGDGQPSGQRTFQDVIDDLRADNSADPVVSNFLRVAHAKGIPVSRAIYLAESLRADSGPCAFNTCDELIAFAYGVAGVVGEMLCPVLGVESREATPFAIDLGIAMQLTNICRDVYEDAAMERRYLPAELYPLNECPRMPAILATDAANGEVQRKVLNIAESYYASAACGMHYIPHRARIGIAIAAQVYRQIGRNIQPAPEVTAVKRVEVSRCDKILIGLRGLCRLRWPHARHDADLHEPLRGRVTRRLHEIECSL